MINIRRVKCYQAKMRGKVVYRLVAVARREWISKKAKDLVGIFEILEKSFVRVRITRSNIGILTRGQCLFGPQSLALFDDNPSYISCIPKILDAVVLQHLRQLHRRKEHLSSGLHLHFYSSARHACWTSPARRLLLGILWHNELLR